MLAVRHVAVPVMDPGSSILIVDDFRAMRCILRRLLGELGYTQTREADDGITAWPLLKSSRFDLLITGWNMRRMQGIDLLRAVRADPELRQLPVLFTSAEARRDRIALAAAVGVNGYLVKPFTAQVLKHKLDAVFASRGSAAVPP